MATFIEIQCDICGLMAQSDGGDDRLPIGWYTTETTDHHGEVYESRDLCPSCFEAIDFAAGAAMAAILPRRNAPAASNGRPRGVLSATEVATRLNVTPEWVRRKATTRTIGQRLGREWLFSEADVAALARPGKPGRPRGRSG